MWSWYPMIFERALGANRVYRNITVKPKLQQHQESCHWDIGWYHKKHSDWLRHFSWCPTAGEASTGTASIGFRGRAHQTLHISRRELLALEVEQETRA